MNAIITARLAGLVLAAGMLAGACPPAAEPSNLDGTCFTHAPLPARSLADPAQRVRAVSVRLQEFEGALLAGVTYRLRYGPQFGFSGDCSKGAGGVYICKVCPASGCKAGGDTFRILLPDADTLRLVSDKSGVRADNPQGGRDRLHFGSDPSSLVLERTASADCAT